MDNLNKLIEIVFDKEYKTTGSSPAYFLQLKEYPTYNTLVDIYSNIQNDSKKKNEFVNCLIQSFNENEIINYNEYIGIAHLSVYTLVRLGYTKEVLQELKKRTKVTILIPVVFQKLIKEDARYFDDDDLLDIKLFLSLQIESLERFDEHSGLSKTVRNYAANIVDLRYENLKKSVKSINLEINFDKKIVTEKLGYLGFDKKFTELLDEIDIYINTDNSKFVNSAMIGNLRVFMEDIFKDIARNISIKLNEEIPKIEGRSEMGNVRNYIKRNIELHENEEKFINNFINILHTEGGHSFTSETEYFRLARNIAIEIALLILTKYEKKFSK